MTKPIQPIVAPSTKIGELTQDNINTLADAGIIPSNTPAEQVSVFAHVCSERGISPFSGEIYLVRYKDKGGAYKYSRIVGINGFRKIASETGQYAGSDDVKFNLQSSGKFKTAAELKSSNQLPVTASVTVYRIVGGIRCPFTHTAVFNEFNTSKQKWKTMPFQMISKVAEAFALRKGFSDRLTGLSVPEEQGAFEDAQVPVMTNEQKEELERAYQNIKAQVSGISSLISLSEFLKSNPMWDEDEEIMEILEERKDEIISQIQDGVDKCNDLAGLQKYWEQIKDEDNIPEVRVIFNKKKANLQ